MNKRTTDFLREYLLPTALCIGLALALGTLLFFFLVGLSLVGLRYFNKRSAELGA